MHLAAPSRRVLGLTAVGAIAMSTTILSLGGVAQAIPTGVEETATPSAWSFTYAYDGDSATVAVPAGYCGITWTLIGGSGGAGSTTPGLPGGKLVITTEAEAGDEFFLAPGGDGGDFVQGAGGSGGASYYDAGGPGDASGGNGDVDGVDDTVGGGGGGAATIVEGEYDFLGAYGGDGGDGGDGGFYGWGYGDGENTFGGTATTDGAATTTGNGSISGVGVPCAPATPYMNSAEGQDGALRLDFVDQTEPGDIAVTGYQYSVNGGAPVDFTTTVTDGRTHGTVTGLTNGTTYSVKVRAKGANGTFSDWSAAATGKPFQAIGAPTGLVVTTSPSSVRVTWNPPASGVVTGYDVGYSMGEMGSRACTLTASEARVCVFPATSGTDYLVTVAALDSNGDRGMPARAQSGVVPAATSAAAFPAAVPTKDGDLVRPAGQSGSVAPKSTITITGGGYLPGSVVTILAYSTPQVLTTTVADANGFISVTVTVPDGLPAGSHTLVAAGVDRNGETHYLTLPITVTGGTTGSGGLAYTGADVAVPALGGLAALAIGGGLVLAGRRKRAAE